MPSYARDPSKTTSYGSTNCTSERTTRAHGGRALRYFAGATGISAAETFMAKGLLDYEDPHALGTVGLQSRDYAMAGFEDADGHGVRPHDLGHGSRRVGHDEIAERDGAEQAVALGLDDVARIDRLAMMGHLADVLDMVGHV